MNIGRFSGLIIFNQNSSQGSTIRRPQPPQHLRLRRRRKRSQWSPRRRSSWPPNCRPTASSATSSQTRRTTISGTTVELMELDSEFLALHESRILGHSSNPVCGFSIMEEVRLCCLAHRELAWHFLEPDTWLDHCLRILLSCFRARTSSWIRKVAKS